MENETMVVLSEAKAEGCYLIHGKSFDDGVRLLCSVTGEEGDRVRLITKNKHMFAGTFGRVEIDAPKSILSDFHKPTAVKATIIQ